MRTSFIIAAALLAVALPATAMASRAATRSERSQLRSAVTKSKLVTRSVRHGHFKLLKARISTEGPWARAYVVPNNTYTDPFNAPRGLFKLKHGSWKLVSVGTRRIGCSHPRAPKSVRSDLKLRCG
jgi:hypothetical protein